MKLKPAGERVLDCGVWAAAAATVLAILVIAAVPPVDRDALTHHLALPKLYLKHGGIVEIPEVPFSYYPMNLELLYLGALFLGSDIAPKYIHFGFALLTAGLIWAYLRRRAAPGAAGLGVLLFLSLPVVVKLSVTVYVDLGLMFFSTAAWIQLFRWAESGLKRRHLLAAGVFAGLSLGTKPNGMLVFFCLACAVPFLHRRSAEIREHPALQGAGPGGGAVRRELRAAWLTLAFAAVALAVFSPWLVRNYRWTGNPVHPWAQGLFGAGARPADPHPGRDAADDPEAASAASEQTGLGHFAVRKLLFGENLPEILSIPLRVFFQGRDDDPRLFDGRLNPYLLFFPIVALLPLARRPRAPALELELRLLGIFAGVYLAFAFLLTDMRVRYLGPILPPLAILAAIGVGDLMNYFRDRRRPFSRRLGQAALAAAIGGLLALNGVYIYGLFGAIEPIAYLSGRLSREAYILKHRPEYAAISWANRYLPADARILGLFNGNRIYYSDRAMVCDTGLFAALVESGDSAEALRDGLLKRGFSHLLVRVDLFNQWAGQRFDGPSRMRLQGFIDNHLRELVQAEGYLVFQIERS